MLQGLEHLCCGHRLRAGGVQAGEGSGETSAPFPAPNEPTRELERDFGQGHGVTGQGVVTSD